jgi:acetylornithine deacetylase/succinyl-diaminopimelate desuccinylase-like protein
MRLPVTTAHEYIEAHFSEFHEQLNEFLRIPSVSTSADHAGEVHRAAEWLATELMRIGIDTVEIIPTPGHPIIYAEWMKAGSDAPTVLIYGHYDVQPAAMSDGWESDPFIPVERNGFIYARGASDDKGQIFAHVKAAEALLATGNMPVNLKFLIEGEEEIGSPHLSDFVSNNAERLKADVCVISDGGMPSIEQPSIVYSLRGLAEFELEVFGPAQDLHSGVYGGSVHNPAQAIAEIIAKLHDATGTVAVPGFYDDVIPLAADERTELSRSAWKLDEWKAVTGAPAPWGEPDYAIHERTGARPTLEINGIAGGYFEPGFKTVLPAKAWAKISCRLVANQDPDQIAKLLIRYVEKITPTTVRSQLIYRRGAPAAFVDIHTPAMQAAITAYEHGYQKKPIFMREGGSIPVVADFQKELGIPVILMGLGLNNDGAHGPNEHFMVDMFSKGIHTAVHFHQAYAQKGN